MTRIGGAGRRAEREEDRHVELRHRIPERPPGGAVEARRARKEVCVLRDDLERVEPVGLDGFARLGDDRVGLALDPPLVDRRHRTEAVGVGADTGGLVLDILRQRRVDMEQRPVDARVVHVGDEVAGAVLERVGRQEDLGVVLAVDRPDQTFPVVVHPEIAVGREADGPVGRRLEEERGVARRPIADAKSRLVVPGVTPLPQRHVIGHGRVTGERVGRAEAVGVRVDDRRHRRRR